jgi:hypothetical protein
MIIRHGDIVLVQVSEIPIGLETSIDNVLARGEATGHAHRVQGAQVLLQNGTPAYIIVHAAEGASLSHEEHGVVPLVPGAYKILSQREFDPYDEVIRDVQD